MGRLAALSVIAGVLVFGAGPRAEDVKPASAAEAAVQPTPQDMAAVLKRLAEVERQLAEERAARAQNGRPQRPDSASILARLDDLEKKVSNLEDDPAASPNDFRVFWKEGVKFETQNGDFKFSIGGRAFTDFGWFGSESGGMKKTFGNFQDGVEFRKLRLCLTGDMYTDYLYKIELDFAGGKVIPRDVYMGVRNIPFVGRFQVGHFKEPFSMENLMGDPYITFMEQALPYVFAPDRNVGMMVMNTFCKDRGTWALGVFRETNDAPTVSSDRGYALTGRVTGLPWYENKGEKLLHVGMAASLRKQPFDTLQLQQRPEFHLAPYLASTPTFTAERQGLIDPEIALVCGPFAMQSEYMQDFVTGTSRGNDVNFHSFYVEGTCFLTGEHRPYDVKAGLFARVIPKNNFSPRTGGLGAWQVAARYSTLDLTNDGITGNTMQDFTLGVN